MRSNLSFYFGLAAFTWSTAFAMLSFYWALGGTIGSKTIGPAITSLAKEPSFLAILWVTGGLKVLLGLLALALIRLPVRPVPRWMLLAAGWAAGIGMTLYGGASSAQHALMLAGAIELPAGLGETAARWHLFLWDPWWILGGVLFIGTAWLANKHSILEEWR